MRVYKALMRLYKRSYSIIIPTIIYVIITAIFAFSAANSQPGSLSAKDYRVAIVNEDGSKLSKAVEEYIQKEYAYNSSVKTKEGLKEALFYSMIDNGVVIPSDFSDNYQIEEYNYTSFASSFLVGKSLNSYINTYLSYRKVMGEEEAIEKTNALLSSDVKTSSTIANKDAEILNGYRWFVAMFSYVMMISLLNSLNAVRNFNDSEVKSRILSSNITSKDFQKQVVLSMLSISVILYFILVGLSFLLFGYEFTTSKYGIMILGRLLLHVMTITSITYLVNSFALSARMLSMIGNFLSLTVAFIGGVFIPIRYVAKNVLFFSKLTPTYWFTSGVREIITTGFYNSNVMKGIYIESVMIVAFLLLSFAIRHQKRKRSISW